MHQAVVEAGYRDLILDFTSCSAAFPGPMLALCAQIMRLRENRVDAEIVLPENKDLSRLFHNANWAHLLEPRRFEPSTFRGHTQVPATTFVTPDDQTRAVNRIVNAILGAIPDISRSDFAALEWSINEVTDNVIVHSQSPFGGLVQVSTFQKHRKVVEYIVADAGLGIPATLREGNPDIRSDTEALDKAIREGVTRDRSIGQGNGLFGSYQICSHSGGRFRVESGHAKLTYERETLSIDNERIPLDGTLVVAQIDFSKPGLLAEALKFAGRKHQPVDFVESRYEQYNSTDLIFSLNQESKSFGSRLAGSPVRVRLANLLKMCPNQRLVVDLADIPLVSSSFADEAFGKLFVELGPLAFMQRIQFRNVEPTVRSLIDRAISQRAAVGLSR
jgi:anti-sigma regulatory factor (Ser/Thr protein kinase)